MFVTRSNHPLGLQTRARNRTVRRCRCVESSSPTKSLPHLAWLPSEQGFGGVRSVQGQSRRRLILIATLPRHLRMQLLGEFTGAVHVRIVVSGGHEHRCESSDRSRAETGSHAGPCEIFDVDPRAIFPNWVPLEGWALRSLRSDPLASRVVAYSGWSEADNFQSKLSRCLLSAPLHREF